MVAFRRVALGTFPSGFAGFHAIEARWKLLILAEMRFARMEEVRLPAVCKLTSEVNVVSLRRGGVLAPKTTAKTTGYRTDSRLSN